MSARPALPAEELTPVTAIGAVEALWDRIEALVAGLGPDDWSRPTPCAGWDVHDLVGHIGGLTMMFAGVEQPEPPEGWTAPPGLNPIDTFTERAVAARRDRSPDGQIAETVQARHVWLDVLRGLPDLDGETIGPTGPMSQRAFLSVRMFDLWHHLWDLHQALDQPMDLTDDSAAAKLCHAHVVQAVPWLYGKRAGAPEGAGVTLRLGEPLDVEASVAVREGRAGWVEAAPGDVVIGPAAPYSLLTTGRLDREQAAAHGLVAEGPEAERLLGARMFG